MLRETDPVKKCGPPAVVLNPATSASAKGFVSASFASSHLFTLISSYFILGLPGPSELETAYKARRAHKTFPASRREPTARPSGR